MSSNWGEFATNVEVGEETIPAEIVKFFIMKAMQQDNYKTPLPLLPPPPVQGAEPEGAGIKGLVMDDYVIHTIKLLQHNREMRQLIEAAKEQTELMADSQINTFPPALDIPDHPVPESKYKLNYPIQYMDKDYSDFTLGIGEPVPEISTTVSQQLLKKSVAALCAHAGFESTTESVLNCLSDVAEEYISKMLKLLRVTVDRGANFSSSGFSDAMERVFYEMNIGSVRTLHEYYQTRVLQYRETILQECRALNEEYNNMSIPVKHEVLNLDTIRMDEPDDVPEIHFPALIDGECVDELQPSLEPGFQMLHSLEQETHLQNLDSQEEEAIRSDSPSQDGAAMMNADSLSQAYKKRRRI